MSFRISRDARRHRREPIRCRRGGSSPATTSTAAACEVGLTRADVREVGIEPRDPSPLLARFPASARDEIAQLLDDARFTYGVRDDNGMLTAAWPVGLLRRAMLEAGRRLVARKALEAVEHAVEMTVDELVGALTG